MSKARTTLTAPDIVACLKLLTETVSELVADGNFVKTGLGDFYLCAVGTIDNTDESFRPGKGRQGHGVRLRFRPDRSTEARIARTVRVLRDDTRSSRQPNIVCMEAVGKTPDATLVAGDTIRLRGYRLAFDPANEEAGRIPEHGHADPAHALLRLRERGSPPRNSAVAAETEAGDYSLMIRTATAAGTMKEGWMTEPLSVHCSM